MIVRIDRTRMAMKGEFYAYMVTVPVTEVDRMKHSYFIVLDGKEHVPFSDATMPDYIDNMPKGWERYKATLEHIEDCKFDMLRFGIEAFPELAMFAKWPDLFVAIPEFNEGHATRYLTVADPSNHAARVGG
jgi:hypothetical protein